jgi:hypothetical protein
VGVLDEISALMTAGGMGASGYSVLMIPADITSLEVGDALTVRITVLSERIDFIDTALLPTPTNLGAEVTMAKEGF